MNETIKIVKVGIADLNLVCAPGVIRTSGLGSCVGVILFDQVKDVAGLAHVMLPDSSLAKNGSINVAKYADTAITELLSRLEKKGVNPRSLRAKIAGGAQMFQFSSKSEIMRIGPRNVEAVKKQLEHYKIKLVSEDVGGSSGRTIEFNPKTKMLNIRTVNQGVKEI